MGRRAEHGFSRRENLVFRLARRRNVALKTVTDPIRQEHRASCVSGAVAQRSVRALSPGAQHISKQ